MCQRLQRVELLGTKSVGASRLGKGIREAMKFQLQRWGDGASRKYHYNDFLGSGGELRGKG
jgi:hypothetical protein